GEICATREQLSSGAAWKFFTDREGAVWIATNSGLDRLRHNALIKQALPPAPEREFSIAAGDQGSIWTGNVGRAVTHITADGRMTSFPRTRETICLRRDRNGTIWSAGAGDFHLWRSSGEGFSPVRYPGEGADSVIALAVDRHDQPWINTRSGKVFY